jgi:hypothetical protein
MNPSRYKMLLMILSILLGAFHAGCGLADDPPGSGPQIDASIPSSDTLQGNQMQMPMVDPLPEVVCDDTVPLQGTAPVGSSVFVVGGGTTGLATDTHPVTGRFCMDVPLNTGTLNTLTIRAQDPVLGMSDPVVRTVTHSDSCDTNSDPQPDPTPEQPATKNVALGSEARDATPPETGNIDFLTDGDDKTVVTYQGGYAWLDFKGWVSIRLDAIYMISRIVVKWRDGAVEGGDSYASKYKVLVSSESDPGDPNLDNGRWTVVGDISQGVGGVEEHDLTDTKPMVQHVALWLEKDAADWTWSETFAIGEVEVWHTEQTMNSNPEVQGPNTCAALSTQ